MRINKMQQIAYTMFLVSILVNTFILINTRMDEYRVPVVKESQLEHNFVSDENCRLLQDGFYICSDNSAHPIEVLDKVLLKGKATRLYIN